MSENKKEEIKENEEKAEVKNEKPENDKKEKSLLQGGLRQEAQRKSHRLLGQEDRDKISLERRLQEKDDPRASDGRKSQKSRRVARMRDSRPREAEEEKDFPKKVIRS